jgi:hypothetical protein
MSQALGPNGQPPFSMVGNVSQTLSIIIGQPGGFSAAQVRHFCGSGDPNAASDPDGTLAASALGSVYSRVDGPDSTHCFYVKTAMPVGGTSPTGTWTNK